MYTYFFRFSILTCGSVSSYLFALVLSISNLGTQCDCFYEELLFTSKKEGEPLVETSNAEVEKNVSLEPDEEIDEDDDWEVTEEDPEYDNTYDPNWKPDTHRYWGRD